jgi:tRNA (mo5U34)-methyltransferase
MTTPSNRFLEDLAPHGALLHDAAQSVLAHHDARAHALSVLLQKLPQRRPSHIALDQDCVTIGRPSDLSAGQQDQLREVLVGLKPWRKGPFDLFGNGVQSEWNPALKRRRAALHIAPLTGQRVLDVGSSNGYCLLRMTAQAPRLLPGIEPNRVCYYQFSALQHFLGLPHLYWLPLKLEELAGICAWLDTLFCMGMLYHRRSPLETQDPLKHLMNPGGQLVSESLIIESDAQTALFPRNRYARMRNAFFIPAVNCLSNWMERCGLHMIRCLDITATTMQEKRKMPWIDSESLNTFLDPHESRLTVEGYPAPVRAMVIAEAA